MTANNEEWELKERLKLIETMIAEGRRSTGSWAWISVFWGLAYYVAMAWTAVFHWPWAWLVTMLAAWLLMSGIVWSKAKQQPVKSPPTRMGRAISSVWTAMGISMMLVIPAMGMSGHLSEQMFVTVVGAMLGLANAASGMMLKWMPQLLCAVVWWAASVAACFASGNQSTMIFVVAIFFGLIGFGVYGMICEARMRRLETNHA